MPNASWTQNSFLGGEWAKVAQGQVDNPHYLKAMDVCYNGFPREEGSWTRRPGTGHGATTRGGAPGRLLNFTLSETAAYKLEFTDGYIRFFYGPQLLQSSTDHAVSNISTATPAVITLTVASTALTDGTAVEFQFNDNTAAAACPLLANRRFRLVKTDTTHFSLYDETTGEAIDGSTLGWTAGLNISLKRVIELLSPYTSGTWDSLRLIQGDVDGVTQALLLRRNVAPRILVPAVPASTTTPFTIDAAAFVDGPYLNPTPGAQATASALVGNIVLTLSFQAYDATKAYTKGNLVTSSSVGYRSLVNTNLNNTPASSPTFWQVVSWDAAFGPSGFQNGDAGRLIRMHSVPPLWIGATGTDYVAGDVVEFNGQYWTALKSMTGATPAAGRVSPNQPGVAVDTWSLTPEVARWTWGRITGLGSTSLIPAATGTNIGDLTGGGGLAAAFNSNNFDTFSAAATKTNPAGTNLAWSGYVGKNYSAVPKTIASAIVFPASDTGFSSPDYNPVTISLYGSQGDPASVSGTLLAQSVITDSTNAVSLISNDAVTTWNYVYVIVQSAFTFAGHQAVAVAEVQFYSAPSTGIAVQLLGDPLLYVTAMREFRLGVYADSTYYPTCGCYHEGRFWLGGAVDNRFDASKSNDPLNFSPTNAQGVVADNNAISYVLNAEEKNTMFWMKPDLQGIVVGSLGGEWLIQSGTANTAMAPANIQAHLITKYGCANVEPVRTGLTTVFVQKIKRRLIEYLADAFSGKFYGPNLSKFATHASKTGIEEIAHQEDVAPVVWSRKADGSLAGMTYRRTSSFSSEEAEFYGWHRHALGSGREVESLCTGTSPDGTHDTLAMITNDPVTNIRHVEFLQDMMEDDAVITDAWFVDNAAVPSSGALTTDVAGLPVLRLYGLWHLNGQKVAAWVGGLDMGDFRVASGSIDVPLDANLSTKYFHELTTNGETYINPVAIDAGKFTIPAVVGFTYTSRGRILRPAQAAQAGSQTGPPAGKTRRLHRFMALLHNTQGISFGTRFERLTSANFETEGGTRLNPWNLFCGVYSDTVEDDYSYNGMLCWEVSRPYPATVAQVGGFLATQDR